MKKIVINAALSHPEYKEKIKRNKKITKPFWDCAVLRNNKPVDIIDFYKSKNPNINTYDRHIYNNGIVLHNFFHDKKYNVHLINTFIDTSKEDIKKISECDYVIFSTGYPGYGNRLESIIKTTKKVKKINPQAKIIIGGWDITKVRQSEVHILRKQIGVIFQDYKLLPNKTLYENVAFAMQVCGKKTSKIRSIVPQLLKIVGLQSKMNCYPHEVSGGEKQRAAIARSLVHQPKILLADEPTGNLDSFNADEIIELLLKINKFGTTVVLVTHNREIVNKLRKRVITVENGAVAHDQAVGKYVL